MGFLAILVVIGVGALLVAFANTNVGEGCCSGMAALIMLAGIGATAIFLAVFGYGCARIML